MGTGEEGLAVRYLQDLVNVGWGAEKSLMLQGAAQEGGFWMWALPGNNCKGANLAALLQHVDFCS